jgi:hypothetical protein
MRIVEFDKGLKFLGVMFKGGTKFDAGRLYLDLDAYIRKEVSEYMHHNEFLLQRNTASRKQMRLLGIPQLKGQL